jgi:hypothetical protein
VNILRILLEVGARSGELVVAVGALVLQWSPLIIWLAWWTFAVNWRKTREWLRQGAWAPLVLLLLMIALVWSRLMPSSVTLAGVRLANFWWQLGAVTIIVGLTFLCGVVQDALGCAPPEIDLDPPADGGEGHGHGHH